MQRARISLPQAIFALVVGISLPLIVLATLLMWQLINAERNAVSGGHLAAARTLAALVENEVETHVALATSLASSQALRRGDLAAFHAEAAAVAQRIPTTWIVLADERGQTILSTRQPFGSPLDLSEIAIGAAGRPLDLKRWDVSDLVADPVSGQLTTLLLFPLGDAETTRFTLAVAMQPASFLNLIQNKFGPDAAVAILDRQRRFVARIPDHANRLGAFAAPTWRQAIEQSPVEGTAESITLEGVRSLTSYTATRFKWVAGLSYPLDVLYAPVRRQIWTMGVIGAGLLAIAMLIAALLSQQISAEVRAVSRQASRLADAEVVPRESFHLREVQTLNSALADASQTLHLRLDELKSARLHQSFLLRELAHRLKNLLTVVNSMVRQTARSASSTTDLVAKLGDRVQGLAIGIDLLVNQQWQSAPLKTLIAKQLAPFCPAEHRLTADGPAVDLSPDLTQSLGLALHEMATNAVKYGAWSNDRGTIRVSWEVANVDREQILSLTWSEMNGPEVKASPGRGFGQVVIAQAAGRGNRARSHLEFEPDGVRWHLSARLDQEQGFPAHPAAAPATST